MLAIPSYPGVSNPTLHHINAAAAALGFLDPGKPILSLTNANDGLARLRAGLSRLKPGLAAIPVAPATLDVIGRITGGSGGMQDINDEAILHALRVTRQLLDERKLSLEAPDAEKTVVDRSREKNAIDDLLLVALFESARGLPVRPLKDIDEELGSARFRLDETEGLWLTRPEDFGPMENEAREFWQGDPLGMLIYRNRRTASVGIIFVVGTLITPWKGGGRHCLGGVMAQRKKFLAGFEAAGGKARDMIKWMAIQLRFNRLHEKDGGDSATAPRVGLGPGKSIVLYGNRAGDKEAALVIHAQVIQEFMRYIGGNDEGTGTGEAGIISGVAPYQWAGSRQSMLGGMFPTLHTADGVTEAALVALEEHIGDLSAPLANLGFGGVGSRMVQNLMHLGLNVQLNIDGNAKNLAAGKKAYPDMAHLFVVEGARQLFPDDEEFEANLRLAQGLNIPIAVNLVDALQRFPETRLLLDNGGPYNIDERLIGYAEGTGSREGRGLMGSVGAANNPFRNGAMAWRAQAAHFLQFDPRFINSLGATMVLGDMLGITPEMTQRHIRAIRSESQEFYREGHKKGIPPCVLGMNRMVDLWDSYLAGGEARGARYERQGTTAPVSL